MQDYLNTIGLIVAALVLIEAAIITCLTRNRSARLRNRHLQ